MPHSSSGNMRPSLAELEQAAFSVVHLMQSVAALANVRIALTGDLAVKKYLQQPGPCESIEFIILSASASQVKKTLLSHGKGSIVERAQALFYRHPAGWAVGIKLTPEWLCSYFPTSAQFVANVRQQLPYVSLEDLFVFKADACDMHESDAGKRKEVRDAGALLELATEHFPLRLEEHKLQRVEMALNTLAEHSPPEYGRRWWEARLGKQGDKRRSVQDILSELGEGLRLDEEENRRTTRRPSVFSLSNRGSETSISSTAASISSQNTTPLSSPAAKMRPRKMSVSGSYSKPRRHTQTMGPPQPESEPPSPAPTSFRDINRLYAETMDTSGRNSPGISLMNFPGKGR
ncbi:hypothetical protein F4808DRAFT_442763 [Astrocystis sublimbata]|nr:hypothetical protein F4808DRAFT_442763 [Astrocystis sublimbata]